jgi:hypothetical protein
MLQHCICRALVRLQARQGLQLEEPRQKVKEELHREAEERHALARCVLVRLPAFRDLSQEQVVSNSLS